MNIAQVCALALHVVACGNSGLTVAATAAQSCHGDKQCTISAVQAWDRKSIQQLYPGATVTVLNGRTIVSLPTPYRRAGWAPEVCCYD